MKILISAYSCEPGMGSEPGVGWNIAREAAKYHEVWVLTRPDESQNEIEAELARNPIPNLHFIYFTLPFWRDSRRWGQSGGIQLHYYLWQIQAYFVARRLHQKISFDLMHHVTFMKYSIPCFLSLLPSPFIWGPVGGGESAPNTFWEDFSWKAKIYEITRSLIRKLGELDPFVHLTTKKSTVVRATTKDTAERLHKIGAKQVQILPGFGLPEEDMALLTQYEIPDETQVRFISIGRLLHWKGFHLGLRAFAQANLPNTEYWIVGEGPECDRLQILARDLGIDRKVKFWGKLPREKALDLLRDCHVLVHPSLHDSGGWVCMEAMAAGRPVLCLDLGGPAIQVTEETGFKVPALEPYQAVRDLAASMIHLVKDPELRISMGLAGRNRVSQNYSWNVIGEDLNKLYTEARSQKPGARMTK
ncbi:MAG: D-inositol-3-phosphate glycosyltransferase [Chroococcidiopsis sp. SAG 2025]|uniref:glycosyltransferase family 4 protein n=1 Tax=Chroococcidiopsis sp. SAG 2025 TaxID=171389 RepID=UPI0029370E2F|nr:glycosyltransferase family 4 protein [Chroococcidiopsis sp. SAG 2025]MDV2996523.1 D-inositol-3-phosphate glycosyltransferase [Chroococcidiopsis sp. SAG 2025]